MPFLQEYFNMLLFFILVLIISCLILFISYFLTVRMIDIEKHLPYECGFDPFSDSRYFLSIQFYFIAVLFIVFDIEIALLFP
jgi:NADH-quinone oxidoreductase subunit A